MEDTIGLKDELANEVSDIFRLRWEERDGYVVPEDSAVKLSNDGVNIEGTVLYADMADSTKLVEAESKTFAAEIYKTFLRCAAKITISEGGTVTAYDGDRVMAVFLGESKNTSAVRAAFKINWAVQNILTPAMKSVYKSTNYVPKHVVGIDSSPLFVARTGVRGANDLVWVGSAANYAAKLTSLPDSYRTYITERVYKIMHESARLSQGVSMWAALSWNFNNSTIYGSTYWWGID